LLIFLRREAPVFYLVTLTCQAILFDLDGVLVDSTPAVARTWTRWALAHGIDPQRTITHAHGRRSIETVRALAPELNAHEENLRVEQMEIEDKQGVTALPGAAHLLSTLPRDRFAIVTSATRSLAHARIGYAGLPLPEHLVTADDVIEGKPSPEPYLKGAQLLGFPASDCLVFEDTPAGIDSALRAGMSAIAVANTYSKSLLTAATEILEGLQTIRVEVAAGFLKITKV
jgi:mannitol-1-/sugar-/sorbitol-6-phosphatase